MRREHPTISRKRGADSAGGSACVRSALASTLVVRRAWWRQLMAMNFGRVREEERHWRET
eukprot:15463111-Alexandrium_andersonii.AAC.1